MVELAYFKPVQAEGKGERIEGHLTHDNRMFDAFCGSGDHIGFDDVRE